MSLHAAPAPGSSKQGAIRSFRGAHGEHQTRDAEGVEFDAPRVETPKASRSWGMGRGIPLPTRLGGLGERRKLPPSGVRGTALTKNDLRLPCHNASVATFVEN